MQNQISADATRPPTDDVLVDIAEYVLDYRPDSDEAWSTARLALMDALGCAFHSLGNPECARILGPSQCDDLMALFLNPEGLTNMPVDEFISRLVI